MARRRLPGLRDRNEHGEEGHAMPRDPETGDRNQYQLYEVLHANGDRAGVAAQEDGARWRRAAVRDRVLDAGE